MSTALNPLSLPFLEEKSILMQKYDFKKWQHVVAMLLFHWKGDVLGVEMMSRSPPIEILDLVIHAGLSKRVITSRVFFFG